MLPIFRSWVAIVESGYVGRSDCVHFRSKPLQRTAPNPASIVCMAGDPLKTPSALHKAAAERLAARDFAAVEVLCRQLLAEQPDDAGAWFLLGRAALQAGQPERAQEWLREASVLAPDRADCLAELARVYSVLWRHGEAAAIARKALALQPEDAATLNVIAEVLQRADMPAEAYPVFARVIGKEPGMAGYQLNFASASRVLGKLKEARRACEAALDADEACLRAWSMLAELDPDGLSARRFEVLVHAFAALDANMVEANLHLGFALARALEARNDYVRAFEVLHASKQPARRMLNYSFSEDAQIFAGIMRIFDSASTVAGDGACQSQQPVFVMGMPRTGTTVLERMLSSHPAVHSAGEVHNFGILLQRAAGDAGLGKPSPEVLSAALQAGPVGIGEDYINSIAERIGVAGRFVDKLPHNFLFAGFIARALPQAKMLCLRRNPMDTCVGNFRQLFALGFPYYRYSYNIDDTARYYVAFDRLMQHWHTLMPGRILEVCYEDLVTDPEQNIRRVLAHCDLPWDPACLSIAENTAPVTTASAVQVREGINQRAIGRWKKFAPMLSSATSILRAAGVDIEADRAAVERA